MIYNERQLRITASELRKLKQAKKAIEASAPDDEYWITKARLDALDSQIRELEQQVAEYSRLKASSAVHLECNDLSDLPRILISARIANGLSQKELAESLGMTQQQIQRYEATDYMSASLSRLVEIANELGVRVKELWGGDLGSEGSMVFSWNNEDSVDWEKLPYKEMVKRDWLTIGDDQTPGNAVREYFIRAAGTELVSALHRKRYYGGRKPNEFALLAWQARVLEKAKSRTSSRKFVDFELDDSWLPDLVALSLNEDGPAIAAEFLLEHGVILIIEPHLPSTYLDGAAMLSHEGNPIIGLTLRHDRLDNFWFVLFHELGHAFLHLSQSVRFDFFDEEDGFEDDDLEKEADQFALDALTPARAWEKCLSRFLVTEESVLRDAQNLGVHPSIVAGRIRRESENYFVLNQLVGAGCVRAQFGI